jgi:polysaccharide biosynthesis/export protein
MVRPRDLAKYDTGARGHTASDASKRPRAQRQMCALVLLCSMVGCRSNYYTARSLPVGLQAPSLPVSTALNLERMGAEGVGTSQIGPGDLVSLTIVSGSEDEKVTPFPARVAEDGTIVVPIVGSVRIGGMEPIAAEQQITTAAIERGIFRQPLVTITITQRATNRITVLGAVAKPGVVELPRSSCDIASALAAAGGLSSAAGTQVEVLHRGQSALSAKNSKPLTPQDTSGVKLASFEEPAAGAEAPSAMTRIDLSEAGVSSLQRRQLADRDVVNVLPLEKRYVHVTGLVKKPNQIELTRDKEIRVLDAVAMAGGTINSFCDKVYVIRQRPRGDEAAIIKISLSKAKRNGEENMLLAEGDLVSVEETVGTMAVETVSRFFRIAFGVNGSFAAF